MTFDTFRKYSAWMEFLFEWFVFAAIANMIMIQAIDYIPDANNAIMINGWEISWLKYRHIGSILLTGLVAALRVFPNRELFEETLEPFITTFLNLLQSFVLLLVNYFRPNLGLEKNAIIFLGFAVTMEFWLKTFSWDDFWTDVMLSVGVSALLLAATARWEITIVSWDGFWLCSALGMAQLWLARHSHYAAVEEDDGKDAEPTYYKLAYLSKMLDKKKK